VPSVLLVRHAQASFGTADYDVLSELGHRQVEALDAALRERGVRAARLVSGTLRRQRDTARLTGAPECELDERWNEYDSLDVLRGHAELPVDEAPPGAAAPPEISSRELQPLLDGALQRWIEAGEATPCAESWPAFRGRVHAALGELLASLGRGEHAVAVTSGGVIAAICSGLLGLGGNGFVAFNRVTVNAGITKLLHGRSGTQLLAFNEHAHLEAEDGLLTFR
jgi:broad specificity phosphatase PhoE